MIKITSSLLENLSEQASLLNRKRKNYNFHKKDSDLLQRMLNALESTTYVRPHKHINPDKCEIFIVLKGKIVVIEFDDSGNIIDKIILCNALGNYCAEIVPASWHTAVSLEDGSVYYEIKDGPYNLYDDKVFAEWSPEEGSNDAPEYLADLKRKLL